MWSVITVAVTALIRPTAFNRATAAQAEGKVLTTAVGFISSTSRISRLELQSGRRLRHRESRLSLWVRRNKKPYSQGSLVIHII
ncbi:hypothetical protein D3C75_1197980 [compost metagenome]